MPKYEVVVLIYNEPREKTITVYADDENEAEFKAEELVTSWDGVEKVEIEEVNEVGIDRCLNTMCTCT